MHSRRLIFTLAALAVALAATTGCSHKAVELRTINDSENLFHVKVPASWQTTVTPGGLALYATDKLPASETIQSMSVFVLVAKESDQTSPTLIARIVKSRAASRGWRDSSISRVSKTSIGNRPAIRIDIAGTDKSGLVFKGSYYLVRTSGSDVLVIAVAPKDKWNAQAVDDLCAHWYWHLPPQKTKVL